MILEPKKKSLCVIGMGFCDGGVINDACPSGRQCRTPEISSVQGRGTVSMDAGLVGGGHIGSWHLVTAYYVPGLC